MTLDKANIKRDDSPEVEGHRAYRPGANEEGPQQETDDPQAVESSNILRPPTGEPEVEGHMPRIRFGAKDEGPQQETDDPQLQDGFRFPRNEEPEATAEPDVEAHKTQK